jgi:hypothetical protein
VTSELFEELEASKEFQTHTFQVTAAGRCYGFCLFVADRFELKFKLRIRDGRSFELHFMFITFMLLT